MSDLKLVWDEDAVMFDLASLPGSTDLALEEGLETAIAVSLFTDARAEVVELPPGETDRRGWFGEEFGTVSGDKIGSKLWLLDREKQTEEVRMKAIEYAEEALKWLIDDGVASAIDVDCQFPSRGVWQLSVDITKPKTGQAFKYSIIWGQALAK